ncbi:MAG: hypothetical protein AB7W59_15535 [Acidimicrobiia bacterium]
MSGWLYRKTLRLTCNWFVIGWHCWRKGHDYKVQHVSACTDITACMWCGNYRGASQGVRPRCTPRKWPTPAEWEAYRKAEAEHAGPFALPDLVTDLPTSGSSTNPALNEHRVTTEEEA